MPPQGSCWTRPESPRVWRRGRKPSPRSAQLAQGFVLPTVPPRASLVPGQTGIVRGTGAAMVSKVTSCLLARLSSGERQGRNQHARKQDVKKVGDAVGKRTKQEVSI